MLNALIHYSKHEGLEALFILAALMTVPIVVILTYGEGMKSMEKYIMTSTQLCAVRQFIKTLQ